MISLTPTEKKPDPSRNFVIIGAGPAGLTAAYELTKHGLAPTVLEKSHIVGGIARTENYKGFHFDMGGHRFFTKSEECNQIWQELLADDFLLRPRLSRIFYRQKFFDYPLKPMNALKGLGLIESVLIMASYARWQMFPYRKVETFEQWVTNRFGRRLFNTFFKSYTEKVWGISCSELSADWAAQRIKDLSLKSAVMSMFFKPRKTIKTLIEQFDYPRLGPGMMWRAAQNHVNNAGGEVRLNCDVVSVRHNGTRIESIDLRGEEGTTQLEGTDFISSMPLTELVQKMSPAPPQEVLDASHALKYRDFLTVCLISDKAHVFPDNWIYIHDPGVKVGRIQNFGNWSQEMVPNDHQSSLGLEYFCNEGDELWNTADADLIELGKREVDKLGLVSQEDIVDGCVFRVPKSYPVYDGAYTEHVKVLRDYVESFENLKTIGRNGLHRYNNQDHAMLTGLYAVRNMLFDEQHDLWSVNADQDYHEEQSEEDEQKASPQTPGRNHRFKGLASGPQTENSEQVEDGSAISLGKTD